MESYRHLQSPWLDEDSERGYDIARGWGVARRPWAKGLAYSHSGSNGVHYSVVWLAPAIDFAVLVTTNQGGAGEATDQAAAANHIWICAVSYGASYRAVCMLP